MRIIKAKDIFPRAYSIVNGEIIKKMKDIIIQNRLQNMF